ncbi:hypothetical protein LJC52_04945 [Bacteroidales bacterium OttesenSCG-928-A17]|nr:hypothetical protein [Bacteroidales bacterium OttesenSCG-928-A17]
MDSTNKINLFKERTLGERFSAAAGFTRQNWKIIAKNLLYVGIPLALIMGFGLDRYMKASLTTDPAQNPIELLLSYGITLLGSMLIYLFISGITGAIMQKYQANELNKETGWTELGGTALRIIKNLFFQMLLLTLISSIIILCIAVIVALIAPEMDMDSSTTILISVGIIGIFSLIALALAPSVTLIVMPVIIENKPVWESIKKGFRLGFKYWGSTFVTALLGGLLYGVAYTIFLMPYSIYLGISIGTGGQSNDIVSFVLILLPTLVMLFTLPVYIVFLAFQYCSVVEREEGITLTKNIDSFEKM